MDSPLLSARSQFLQQRWQVTISVLNNSRQTSSFTLKHPRPCAEHPPSSWLSLVLQAVNNKPETWNWVCCFTLTRQFSLWCITTCTSSLQFLGSQCPQHNPKAGAERNNLSRTVREHLDLSGSCSLHCKATSLLYAGAQQLGVKIKPLTAF